MNEKMSTPKFLTPGVAETADALVFNVIERVVPRPQHFHIVVLVPSMKDDRETNFADWPNYGIRPHVLYERGCGDKATWKYPFDEIARCKALQLWQGRNDGSTDIMPHLLFPSDTPFYGGVKRDRVVVACSGFEPWIDRMVAGMIADVCIGLAYDAWMKSDDKADNERCFLK